MRGVIRTHIPFQKISLREVFTLFAPCKQNNVTWPAILSCSSRLYAIALQAAKTRFSFNIIAPGSSYRVHFSIEDFLRSTSAKNTISAGQKAQPVSIAVIRSIETERIFSIFVCETKAMKRLLPLYQTIKKYLTPYFPVLSIILLAIAAFTLYRLCFLFFNRTAIPADTHNTLFLYSRSMVLGLNFDLVIILYLVTPFFLFLFIKEQFNSASKKGFAVFRWFILIMFTLCFLICAADIPFFRQFGNHLTKMFFVWTESPGFVLHLIFSNVEYWGYLLLFVLLTAFFYTGSRRIFAMPFRLTENRTRTGRILTFLALAGLTFIGIRGRTAWKSPIRVGIAFFCEYTFFNQLGLNPCFVFFDSLKEHKKERGFLADAYSDADLNKAIRQISPGFPHPVSDKFEREYAFDSLPRNYNVMLVLMESMSISKMGYYGNPHLTSRFDSIAAQGVFFDHFYSAGIHTFNGLFSTETGFPAIMDTHPLNTYMDKPFKGISYWLKQNGYARYFFTSHDPQFDNMEAFFLNNDFEQIYSQYDFPMTKASGPLGLPDHFLLESALQKMDEHLKMDHKPFFSYIMTSSDHGPWVIPADIPFRPTAGTIQDRATQYADWSIGNFIQKAKQYSWFTNTYSFSRPITAEISVIPMRCRFPTIIFPAYFTCLRS